MNHDKKCGLGEGTHYACDCQLARMAELEAEVKRLQEQVAYWRAKYKEETGGID